MVDAICHKIFFCSGSSYSDNELDDNSRQFLDCYKGTESNDCPGAADDIFHQYDISFSQMGNILSFIYSILMNMRIIQNIY